MSGHERAQEAGIEPTLDVLVRGDMEILGLMPNASNYTFLVALGPATGEGADRTLAVYKPETGETPLWDFPDGTLGLREVAAYEVARALGWPDVPPTVLREGPHGPGSVQLFVDFDDLVGRCVRLLSDPANCGRCGRACRAGQRRAAGLRLPTGSRAHVRSLVRALRGDSLRRAEIAATRRSP